MWRNCAVGLQIMRRDSTPNLEKWDLCSHKVWHTSREAGRVSHFVSSPSLWLCVPVSGSVHNELSHSTLREVNTLHVPLPLPSDRRRCLPADGLEHRRPLPRHHALHHLRGLHHGPAVLRDLHLDPHQQANLCDADAGNGVLVKWLWFSKHEKDWKIVSRSSRNGQWMRQIF